MRRKLHRGRKSGGRMFGRRRQNGVFGWVLLIVLALAAGAGTIALLSRVPAATPSESDTSSTTGSTTVQTTAPTTTAPPASASDTLRMAVLPLASLRDTATRGATLDGLKAQGYTAVSFDLKDGNGVLHYAFTGKWATEARTVADDAMTAEEMKALLADCDARGLAAVPRLFAFYDRTAPNRLKTARINWSGDRATLWLDASAAKGGRAWLNPYAADARAYLAELATELKAFGVPAILFDGVQFPKNTYQAYFGTEETDYQQALSTFVNEMQTALGDSTQMLLTLPLAAAKGEDTAVFGGNPLTYGADGVCPIINNAALASYLKAEAGATTPPAASPAEALTKALADCEARLNFIDGDKPTVMPWLASDVAALYETLKPDAPCVVAAK